MATATRPTSRVGDNFAGTCNDGALPYDVADPVEVRRRAVSDYLDQLPDDVFAPWTKEQWTAFYYAPYICVGWPVPDHHEAVLPAGMTFPEIPALILAGQLEPTVSLSKKLLDVFPNGEFYVVPGRPSRHLVDRDVRRPVRGRLDRRRRTRPRPVPRRLTLPRVVPPADGEV